MKNSTSPEGLGHVLDSRGLESGVERRPGELSITERLRAADKALEDALRSVEAAEQTRRALQKLRLRELEETEKLQAVTSSFFKHNSPEARVELKQERRYVVFVHDGSGAVVVVEQWASGEEMDVRPWDQFRRELSELAADVSESGRPYAISFRSNPVAVVRPLLREVEREYELLARTFRLSLDE